MITHISDCGPEEIAKHARFLETTPVFEFADIIRKNSKCIRKGMIKSLSCLGNLKTIFENLGGIKARQVFGQDLFLIEQALEIWRKPHCNDEDRLKKVEQYIEDERQGKLKLTITVEKRKENFVVVDGNKSAVAFFEVHKIEPQKAIDLSAYLIDRTGLF